MPKTCAIILAVSESYRASAATAGDDPAPKVGNGATGKTGASIGAAAEGRGPGRKPNKDANHQIAGVVGTFGSDWRSRLVEVCGALDEQKVPVPMSAKWKNRGCGDWADVLTEDQEGLAKALQYRLDWVAEHPISEPDQLRDK